jgi:hypothetical protein
VLLASDGTRTTKDAALCEKDGLGATLSLERRPLMAGGSVDKLLVVVLIAAVAFAIG